MYDEDDVYMGEGFFGESKCWVVARKIAGVVYAVIAIGVAALVILFGLIAISGFIAGFCAG